MKADQMEDVLIFGGGIIPDEDVPRLKEMGIAEIFQPGTHTDAIVQFLRESVPESR